MCRHRRPTDRRNLSVAASQEAVLALLVKSEKNGEAQWAHWSLGVLKTMMERNRSPEVVETKSGSGAMLTKQRLVYCRK